MAVTLIMLAVKLGVVLTVLALGLGAVRGDAAYLVERPAKLGKALLAMNVIMPAFAVGLALLFQLRPAVAVALMALAVAPIPPLLPRKALKSGGGSAYIVGLLVAATALAIVFVPLAVDGMAALFGKTVHVSLSRLVAVVALSILVPLAVGMLVRRFAARFAGRAAKPVAVVGLVLLVAGAVPVLVVLAPAMVALLGNGTLAAIVAFVVVGLVAGHLLGGPDSDERSALALMTSTRHPGVAFVVASATAVEQRPLVAALLLYLVVAALVTLPYQVWSRRHHARVAHAVPT